MFHEKVLHALTYADPTPEDADVDLPNAACPRAPGDRAILEKLVLALATHDWLIVGYLLVLLYEVIVQRGPGRTTASALLVVDLTVFVGVLVVVRGGIARRGFLASLIYRFGVLFGILGPFFQLQWILPAASGPPVDAALLALDLRLFGVEPALAWDRFVRPATTEWFSFFYYSYFFLVAAHVLPALFFERRRRLVIAFGFGVMWIYCLGHVTYTFVPAHGPWAYGTFQHALEGDTWWRLVRQTVDSVDGSARCDVFPSLHTAGPAFLTLFSFIHRKHAPFRYTAAPLAFFTSQIILATMFLRWHYLIDICAGLVLAVSAVVAGRAALWWDEGRVAAGGQPAFPPWSATLAPSSPAGALASSGE